MTGLHPLLASAFAALDEDGVTWAVLRGEDDLAAPQGDVDLLVGNARRAGGALERAGFRRLRTWGHGTHRFYLGFDVQDGTWIKLDVVTELAFGPYQAFGTRAEGPLLARAEKFGPIRTLAGDDAFWALLLHCLLDRGDIPPRHAAALTEKAAEATPESPLAKAAPLDAARVVDAARDGRWDDLTRFAPRLASRWWRRRPLQGARRRAVGAALLRLTPLLVPFRARGRTVALLGPDGAGKSTVSDALEQAFPFHRVRRLYLGLYSPKTRFRGPGILRLPARLVWLATTRAQILRHRLRGRVIVLDRHTYDALLERPARPGLLARIRLAILARGAPRPDVLVLLDAPGAVMAERKPEHTADELEAERKRYLQLAERLGDVLVLDATAPVSSIVRGIVSRTRIALH